ncbi:MAG TPA: hypothetical protein PKN99_10710 [Cyclobacteriaceae bacterium]|nr:hypothetical protein [Cyclobacteriaceae bacterium]
MNLLDKIEQFKNLICVVIGNGVLNDIEKEVIRKNAIEIGMSEIELKNMFTQKPSVNINLPDTEEERERFLIDVISMSLVDGKLTRNEYALCLMFAERLQFNEVELKLIIRLSHGKVPINLV